MPGTCVPITILPFGKSHHSLLVQRFLPSVLFTIYESLHSVPYGSIKESRIVGIGQDI